MAIAFQAGKTYRGRVSGAEFTVTEIRQPGNYKTSSGGLQILCEPFVTLIEKRDGRSFSRRIECSLALLQNLLAEEI